MIPIFCNFFTNFGGKNGVFLNNQCSDQFFSKIAVVGAKNANIFAKFFGENILEIITSVPGRQHFQFNYISWQNRVFRLLWSSRQLGTYSKERGTRPGSCCLPESKPGTAGRTSGYYGPEKSWSSSSPEPRPCPGGDPAKNEFSNFTHICKISLQICVKFLINL
jgi:hypothetical protein